MKLDQSCRGDEAKRAMLEKYDIKPISYVKLLEGQVKEGCCGEIKDRYYAFEFKDRKTGQAGGFFVGYHCGHEFLALLKIDKKKYPLFNPLRELSELDGEEKEPSSSDEDDGEKEPAESTKVKMEKLNIDVYNAIHLVITAWSGAPYGDYANIISYIKNNPDTRVSDAVAKKVNYLISKDKACRPLVQIVDELRAKYPSLKEFKFDELKTVVDKLIAASEVSTNYIQ